MTGLFQRKKREKRREEKSKSFFISASPHHRRTGWRNIKFVTMHGSLEVVFCPGCPQSCWKLIEKKEIRVFFGFFVRAPFTGDPNGLLLLGYDKLILILETFIMF